MDADVVTVRDSKTANEVRLAFTRSEWDAFTAGVRNGEFDHVADTTTNAAATTTPEAQDTL